MFDVGSFIIGCGCGMMVWAFFLLWIGIETKIDIDSHPCHSLVIEWVDMINMDFHFLSLCRKV